jgi:hypothetical protein
MGTGPIDGRQIQTGLRRSCLGCLGKLVVSLVGVLVLGMGLLLAMDAALKPWSFYMGGRFHLIPMWEGWGKLHSQSGRDYALWMWLEPAWYGGRGSVSGSGGNDVRGWGTLCTPRGDRYRVRVTGYQERHMGASTEGKRMDMQVYRRPWYWGFTGTWDHRPQLRFLGAWHNPDLVLYDHGSLDRAFNADGTLRPPNSGVWRPGEQGVELILREGTKSEFEAACREVQSH